ncbi:hypothetical protein TNIN_19331 [Trichonephila inaurata madagascariensis]|uniref:Uncharacterized protein n=1 Tax=Trichonephila inaurata madagascariensis TaxID=2747483 RepID=A0A8X6XK54_9ARAC|nr:hypothetical protein TNIN_19331 [Trichonephila inaurata madagascariensis]
MPLENNESTAPGPIKYRIFRRYPDNGAKATRLVLICFIGHILASTTFLTVSFLLKQEIFLYLCGIYCVTSVLLLMVILIRIFRFYQLRRGIKASGLVIDPDVILSLANYMRILAFLTPKGYPIYEVLAESETQTESNDFSDI